MLHLAAVAAHALELPTKLQLIWTIPNVSSQQDTLFLQPTSTTSCFLVVYTALLFYSTNTNSYYNIMGCSLTRHVRGNDDSVGSENPHEGLKF